MQINNISIVGLGKLGLPLALLFAKYKYYVVGYDSSDQHISRLQRGEVSSFEPKVHELLEAHKNNITFTVYPEEILKKSNVTFIVVPTPSKKDGSFSSQYIEDVLRTISPYLKKKKTHHTIVITSTVSPGTIENVIKPLLESSTLKKVGDKLGLCYSPELIALGTVINNLQSPDFIFIGESNTHAGKIVETLRKSICINNPSVVHTNWVNAELIKLSLNAYITSKLSFANMIARLCEHTRGADSEVVLNSIGKDKRIGINYLKGGLGYGGPCFPRDTLSLDRAIKKAGLQIKLPLAVHLFNEDQILYLFKLIKKISKSRKTIGILGLGYKQNTDVVEKSQAVLLAKKLLNNRYKVFAYDPIANNNAKEIEPRAHYVSSIQECIGLSEVVLIMTPYHVFTNINWNNFTNKIIIDCWRVIKPLKAVQSSNKFIQLGSYIQTQ
jgi:UDPglucose 6-dehydrogenase